MKPETLLETMEETDDACVQEAQGKRAILKKEEECYAEN